MKISDLPKEGRDVFLKDRRNEIDEMLKLGGFSAESQVDCIALFELAVITMFAVGCPKDVLVGNAGGYWDQCRAIAQTYGQARTQGREPTAAELRAATANANELPEFVSPVIKD